LRRVSFLGLTAPWDLLGGDGEFRQLLGKLESCITSHIQPLTNPFLV
jgi:hypothetical protein